MRQRTARGTIAGGRRGRAQAIDVVIRAAADRLAGRRCAPPVTPGHAANPPLPSQGIQRLFDTRRMA